MREEFLKMMAPYLGGAASEDAVICRDKFHLTLPTPISANNFWRIRVVKGKPIVHTTKEAAAYKRTVYFICLKEGIRTPLVGPVKLHVRLYPSRPKDWAKRAKDDGLWYAKVQSIDLDNALKVLIDSLKDVAFGDDKWVHSINATRMIPDDKGSRVEVLISPLDMITFTV